MAEHQAHLCTANGLRRHGVLFDPFHKHLTAHQARIIGINRMLKAIIRTIRVGLKTATKTRARTKLGKASSMSMTRMIRLSTFPPRNPDMLPIQCPHDQRTAHHSYGNTQVIPAAIDNPREDIAPILIQAKKVRK